MTNTAGHTARTLTVEQATAKDDAGPRTGDAAVRRTSSQRPTGPGRLSPRSSVARVLWTLAGVLTAVLTLGWVLWGGPHPLLGPGGLDMPAMCWLNPPVYAAALAVWGCLSKASRS